MATVTRNIIINGTCPPAPNPVPAGTWFEFRPGWMDPGSFSFTMASYGDTWDETTEDQPDITEDYYVTMPDNPIIVTPVTGVTLNRVMMMAIVGTIEDGNISGYTFTINS